MFSSASSVTHNKHHHHHHHQQTIRSSSSRSPSPSISSPLRSSTPNNNNNKNHQKATISTSNQQPPISTNNNITLPAVLNKQTRRQSVATGTSPTRRTLTSAILNLPNRSLSDSKKNSQTSNTESERPDVLKRSSGSYSSTSSAETSSSSAASSASTAPSSVASPNIEASSSSVLVPTIGLQDSCPEQTKSSSSPVLGSSTPAADQGSARRISDPSSLHTGCLRSVFRANVYPDLKIERPIPQRAVTSQGLSEDNLSLSMTRRSAPVPAPQPGPNTAMKQNGHAHEMPCIKFIPHQDQRSSRPSLAFAPMMRTLPNETSVIRVGRYSERDLSPTANTAPSDSPIGFKSKVVSRRHCEFWCVNGQWFVKDVKSSSGTFLNHIRLSQPSTESKPFPINDGDIVQLGMDFRGGEESIFRCVKIRIEVNRGWQSKLNGFNAATHKTLRAWAKENPTSSTECSICLMAIAPCQALFVAPCSHVWHYKCIRPLLENKKTAPQFLCPNCRAISDLDADIEENPDGWDDAENDQDVAAVANRVETPVNETSNGDDVEVAHATQDSTVATALASQEANAVAVSSIQNSGVSNEELQDTTGILFSETAPINIRDPRTVPETLEGVVTPRNEAGPFVFNGTESRLQSPETSA